MESCDITIIGAGISGLSLAHLCAKAGLKTIVIEKSDRVGGCFHSHRFDLESKLDRPFWLELGAHTCYNSYGSLIKIIEETGIKDELRAREKAPFVMFSDGKIRSIPSMLNFPELMYSIPRMLKAGKSGETMRSYYSRILGKKNYANVFGPVFDAIISQSADNFPADALFKKKPRNKDYIKSFTFSGGLSTITDSIAGEAGITVLKGRAVNGAYRGLAGFITVTADGEEVRSSYLALAVPPPAASKILMDGFPDISKHLSRINAGTVETVGVLINRQKIKIKPVTGIIARNETFFSGVSRDVVADDTYRGFAFHFKPGILDLDRKLEKIASMLGIKRDDILSVVEKNDNSVPSLSPGHEGWVKETNRLLAGRSLFITGNYFDGVAIEDCVARSFSEFARLRRSS